MSVNIRTGRTLARLTTGLLAATVVGANLGCALWVDDKKHEQHMRQAQIDLKREREGMTQEQGMTGKYKDDLASAKEELKGSQDELAVIQQQMLRIPPGVARDKAGAKLDALKTRASSASAAPDSDSAKYEARIKQLKAEVAELHDEVKEAAAH